MTVSGDCTQVTRNPKTLTGDCTQVTCNPRTVAFNYRTVVCDPTIKCMQKLYDHWHHSYKHEEHTIIIARCFFSKIYYSIWPSENIYSHTVITLGEDPGLKFILSSVSGKFLFETSIGLIIICFQIHQNLTSQPLSSHNMVIFLWNESAMFPYNICNIIHV